MGVATHLPQEMEPPTKTAILLLTWALVDVLGAAAQTEGIVTSSCCPQVFLSSSGSLEQTQSAALGIYTLSSQKIAGNPHPVYLKSTPGQDHSFSIECHSDQVKIDCCKTITLKANPNGPIATHQGGVLGDYVKAKDVNGHTAYSGPMGTSLFFR